MNNVTINISGNIHIHVYHDDLEYLFEEEGFEEEEDIEEAEPEIPDIHVTVCGLPENINRDAVSAVIASACEALNGLLGEAAAKNRGEAHE